jgi:hypothetical protein
VEENVSQRNLRSLESDEVEERNIVNQRNLRNPRSENTEERSVIAEEDVVRLMEDDDEDMEVNDERHERVREEDVIQAHHQWMKCK